MSTAEEQTQPQQNGVTSNGVTSTDEYDYLLRIVLLGTTRVGKTSLIRRFTDDTFDAVHKPTIGSDFVVKKGVKIDDTRLLVHFIDNAGQERFRNLLASYMRGFMTYFLIYDVTDFSSIDSVRAWHRTLQNAPAAAAASNAPRETIRFLIANKTDASPRLVSTEEGKKLAEELDMVYWETSALSGDSVGEVFKEGLRRSVELYKKTWEVEGVVEDENEGKGGEGGGWCNAS